MLLEQTLQTAITHHKAGELDDAEQLYRSILTEESKHPDANHNLGILLQQGDQADIALPFFKTALESNPNQGQFWISYIDTLIHLGQLDAARTVLEQGQSKGLKGKAIDQLVARLNSQPETTSTLPQVQQDLVIALYSQGQVQKALDVSEVLIRDYPNEPLLYNISGACYQALGQLDAAVKSYEQTLAIKPDYAYALCNFGVTLKELGQLEEAVNRYEQALAIRPDYADAHYNLGNTLKELGQLEEAVKCYEQALAIKPDHAKAHSNLGVTLQELGQLEEAVKRYEQALAIKPDYANAHSNLGNTLKELGQLEEAVKSYEQALAINPDFADTHSNLGNTLKELGQLEEAVKRYEQALAIKPDYADAHYNLGNTLKELGQLDAAVKSYEQALAINSDFVEASYNLGNTLKELGQLEEAVKRYEQALAIKPDHAEAHSNLGNTLKELGQLEEAVKCYEQALAINPDYDEAYNNLGNTLKELGQLDAAVKSYEQALAINSDFVEASYNLGNTLKELGQLDAAVKSYEQALAINSDFAEAQHMINSLTGKTSQSAPKKYVENLFNNYADKFEDSLVNHLEYAMPSVLKKIFLNYGLAKNNICLTVDLGCGTGLCGVEFRDQTEILIGIDLSNKMIAKAKEKNIYDELYINDLINGLKELDRKFDLFISSDVFVYVGDLKDLFNTVSEYATKHSLFIFSTEDEDGDSFHLRQPGRYSHSKKYIVQLASTSGFRLEHFERSNLRKEKGQWIVGGIYMLRRI
jgi:protein O-GlcNAc transferase